MVPIYGLCAPYRLIVKQDICFTCLFSFECKLFSHLFN